MPLELRSAMGTYGRLLRFMWPYRVRLLVAVAAGAAYGASQFLVIRLIEPLFNGVILDQVPSMIRTLPFYILGLYFARGGIEYVQIYLMSYVGNRTVMDIRNALFHTLTTRSLPFFRQNNSGVLLARVTNDTMLVQAGVAAVLRDVLVNAAEIVALTTWIFIVSLKLAALGFFLLPVSIYPLLRFARKLRRASIDTQERMADMSVTLVETLLGIQIVQAFNMEDAQGQRFGRASRGYFDASMRAARVQALSPPLMEFVGAIAVAAIIGFGGFLMLRREITPAEFGQFVAALTMLYKPIKNLSRVNQNMQQAIAAGERIFRVLDDSHRVAESDDAPPLENVRGHIRYEGVFFNYEQDPVLEAINLEVRPGERVALVGTSGSGKSTLVNLLPRFYDPAAGRILVDGRDIRECSLRSLRQNIGLVTQETMLFAGTVAENIAFGRPGAELDEIREAARAAHAHDFIERLPLGYETLIGERGTRLSGGERQRIAIARALLKDPPILILDEATSALDTASESLIQKALDNLVRDRTTLVVAHRISTVQNAHRIHVLEGGRILESGTHDELLEAAGRYRRFYDLQFANREA